MHPDAPIVHYAIKFGFYWSIYKLATGSLLGIWFGLYAIVVNVTALLFARHALWDQITPSGVVLSLVYSLCLLRSIEFRQVGRGPGWFIGMILSLLATTLIIRGAAIMSNETYVFIACAASILGMLYLALSFLSIRPKEILGRPVRHDGLFSMTHGIGPLKNIHFWLSSQRWARDFCVYENGKNIGEGLQVLSPVQGAVERVAVDNLLGQHVILSCSKSPGRYVLIAHLQEGSVVVQAGDMVQQESPLGILGNSGNSTEPHIHMQVQDGPDFGKAPTVPYSVC